MLVKRWFRFFSPKLRRAPTPLVDVALATNDGGVIAPKEESKVLPKQLAIGGKDYRLEHYAEGGICEILKGIPTSGGPKIALKILKEEWLDHQGVRRQFATESQIVRSLNTTQLPKFVSRGVVNGRAYFAYEFIDGIPLIQVSQKPDLFPPKMVRMRSLDITKQLLTQLHYLNTKLNPVAHGDISSENIIFDGDLKIHLVDFGCSHFTSMASKEAFQWIAKPSFISPEQARGENWGHPSDLYQAGILLFELLAAQRWNRGKGRREKMLFAASGDMPDTSLVTEIAGQDVADFVAALLHPNPLKRIRTAKDALLRLDKIM